MRKKLIEVGVFGVFIPVMLLIDAGIAWHYRNAILPWQRVSTVISQQPAVTKLAAPVQTTTYHASLLFMGDVMLARTIGDSIESGDNPFKYVQPTLDKYNFRFANVETTIADPQVASQASGKLYTFNAPLQAIQTLKNAHIDIAGLANNHTKDFGSAALSNMLDNFQAAGIKTVGAGKNVDQAFAPQVTDIPIGRFGNSKHSLRLAIIAANDIENNYTIVTATSAGSAYFDQARIAAAIQAARQTDKADLVIVVPHWGIEYQTTPTDRQIEWAHFFIDSGADMVIGSHPHVTQTIDTYKGKYIAYSMGNFIFDGMSGNALDGEMIGLNATIQTTSGTRTVTLGPPTVIPTHIDTQGYPELK